MAEIIFFLGLFLVAMTSVILYHFREVDRMKIRARETEKQQSIRETEIHHMFDLQKEALAKGTPLPMPRKSNDF